MDVVVEKKFPSENLVPKHETGVLNFLKKYPTYNGEGITIAIFDSGVDPKSAGLQVGGCEEREIQRIITKTNYFFQNFNDDDNANYT